MKKIKLYHGTANEFVKAEYGKDEEKYDYGQGFYLTENIDLVKEWAVCKPNNLNGFVRQFEEW